ncbi:hypothetical protein EYC87_05270 [Halieaceae bacterium IMCC8485]|uniref:Uncharacterized protein n=1 Tax=Candidatus Seongchinamella marina TaxID=2518990 RepID=A0ABT3SSZ4_9GAMM|nr:hypothetical protein [Candidatus Seongchinamella marina]MCX2972994.1 hypothetical protein [Candidatus Seongchinamella marina]
MSDKQPEMFLPHEPKMTCHDEASFRYARLGAWWGQIKYRLGEMHPSCRPGSSIVQMHDHKGHFTLTVMCLTECGLEHSLLRLIREGDPEGLGTITITAVTPAGAIVYEGEHVAKTLPEVNPVYGRLNLQGEEAS